MAKDIKGAKRSLRPGIFGDRRLNNASSPTWLPKKSSQEEEAIGKSRGGLGTKIHAAVGALGNPVRLILTTGQASEYTQAECLIQGFDADYVLAHRGYDTDPFVEMIHTAGATAVIPGIAGNNAITIRKSTKSEIWSSVFSRNSSSFDGLPLVTKGSNETTNPC